MPPRSLSLLPCCIHLCLRTGLAHQPCAPRGCLERGTNLAAVENITSAMSMVMSLMQVPSGIGGSAVTIALTTWHRRFGSAINRLRSAVFGGFFGTVPLHPEWCGPAWDADGRVHEIMIRFWCLNGGPADINAADESAVRLLCQGMIQNCLSLAAVGGLECVGYVTLECAK